MTRFKVFLFIILSFSPWLLAEDLSIPAPSTFQVIPATAEHIQQLKQGGYVIYMRHGLTDARFPDLIPIDLDDVESQRPLSDAGIKLLDQVGKHVTKLKLPYKVVISSPFFRAQESAFRVFGEPIEVDVDLRYTAAMPDLEKRPAVVRTLEWISKPVADPGYNRVVVAHGPNIAELMDYLPPENTLVFFKPLGDQGFSYFASIEPSHWPKLLKELNFE